MDQINALFSCGDISEDVHTILNLCISDQRQQRMDLLHNGIHIIVGQLRFDLIF